MKGKELIIIILALCILAFSKARAQSSLQNGEIPNDLIITLERATCYGTCPNYKLVIQANGTIDFEGREYTKIKGMANGKITSEQVKQLISEFEKARFFSFDEKYPNEKNNCPVVATDMPSATISIKVNAREKTVKHYLGCFKSADPLEISPSELFSLENKIDDIVGTKRWVGEQE